MAPLLLICQSEEAGPNTGRHLLLPSSTLSGHTSASKQTNKRAAHTSVTPKAAWHCCKRCNRSNCNAFPSLHFGLISTILWILYASSLAKAYLSTELCTKKKGLRLLLERWEGEMDGKWQRWWWEGWSNDGRKEERRKRQGRGGGERQTGRWRGMGREEHTAVKVGELEDVGREADKIRVTGEERGFVPPPLSVHH